MRKSMRLGAVSTLAAVALVAGSASAASAFGEGGDDHHKPKDGGPVCSAHTDKEQDAEEAFSFQEEAGHGSVSNCQFGKNNLFNYNPDDAYAGGGTYDSSSSGLVGTLEDLGGLLGGGAPAPAPAP